MNKDDHETTTVQTRGHASHANYVFDNADEYAEGPYCELSALYNAQTMRHLERAAVAV